MASYAADQPTYFMLVLMQSVEIIVAACPVTLPCVIILPLCRILLVINQASIQSIVIIVIISPFLFFVVFVAVLVLFFVVLQLTPWLAPSGTW